MEKVWGIGEVLCLLDADEEVIEYTVVDMGVYMTNLGTWEYGLTLEKDGKTNSIVYHIVQDLFETGYMWCKGGEEMAKFLRSR